MLDVRTPAPGIPRFTVPLAMPSPDHLHVHVLDTPDGELLVDCGARDPKTRCGPVSRRSRSTRNGC